MGSGAGPPRQSARPSLVTCAAHGLHYDPSASAGCVLCRKDSLAPAESSAARRGLFLGAGGAAAAMLLAFVVLLLLRHRTPNARLSPVAEASASPRSANGSLLSVFALPAVARAAANAPSAPAAPLTLQTFGVTPELIPTFYPPAMLIPAPATGAQVSLDALTARVDAERARCDSGSTEACVQEITDCSGARSFPRPGEFRPQTAAQRGLMIMLQVSGPERRAAIASGNANLPPGYAEAAKELGIGHERELVAARRELASKCNDAHAHGELPGACNGGSLAACELLVSEPNQRAMWPRACDVGSRYACDQLSQSLGLTTLAGEAARLRALDLRRCAEPGVACSAHSREEWASSAPDTLRAGISQVCAQRGVAECARLAQQFEQEHSEASLITEVRNNACQLGDSGSCSTMMWLYAEGRGVPRDEQKALALYEQWRAPADKQQQALRTCDAGPCDMLQLFMQRSVAMQKIDDQMMRAQLAPDLTTRRCDGGELSACAGLMNAFRVGRHPDQARAAVFARKVAALLDVECNAGTQASCDELAGVLIGLGGTDHARGLALLDRSCSARRSDACFALATKTADPEQKQSALQRLTVLQEAECNQGNIQACGGAAAAYRLGTGVAKDAEKQREYETKLNKLVDPTAPQRL